MDGGNLAVDVESVVKALDLKRVILVGHSMGGSIGLAAAKRMPGRVVAVVGIDTLQNAEFKFPEETVQKLLACFAVDFPTNVRGMFAQLLPEHVFTTFPIPTDPISSRRGQSTSVSNNART